MNFFLKKYFSFLSVYIYVTGGGGRENLVIQVVSLFMISLDIFICLFLNLNPFESRNNISILIAFLLIYFITHFYLIVNVKDDVSINAPRYLIYLIFYSSLFISHILFLIAIIKTTDRYYR